MNTLGNVATHVKNYVDQFELKGSKRDEKTITTWAGVYLGLCTAGHEDSEWIGRVGALLVATRGYSELDNIIRKATEAEAA